MKYGKLYYRGHSKEQQIKNALNARWNKIERVVNSKYKDIAWKPIECRDIAYLFSDLKNLHPVIGKICKLYTSDQKGTPQMLFSRSQTRMGLNMPTTYLSEKESLYYAINGQLHFKDELWQKQESISRLYGKAMSHEDYVDMAMFSLGVFAFNNAVAKNYCPKLLDISSGIFSRIIESRLLTEIAGVFKALISIIQKDFKNAMHIIKNVDFNDPIDLNNQMERMILKYIPEETNVISIFSFSNKAA